MTSVYPMATYKSQGFSWKWIRITCLSSAAGATVV